MVHGVIDSMNLCQIGIQLDVEEQIHWRIVMGAVCVMISSFKTQEELLRAFIDYITGNLKLHQISFQQLIYYSACTTDWY